MELTGDLSDFPLSDILQILALSRKTGTLILRGDQDQRGTLVFIRGKLVQAITDTMHCSLGELLLQEDAITQDILEEMLMCQVQMPAPQPLGTILVDRGIITRDYLQHAIRRQIQASIDEMLRWKRGNFEVKLNAIPVGRGIPYITLDYIFTSGLNIEELLLEATRSLDEAQHEEPDASQSIVTRLLEDEDLLPELEADLYPPPNLEADDGQLPEFDVDDESQPEFDLGDEPQPAFEVDDGPLPAFEDDEGPQPEIAADEERLPELEEDEDGVEPVGPPAACEGRERPRVARADLPPQTSDWNERRGPDEKRLAELDEILSSEPPAAAPGLTLATAPGSKLAPRNQVDWPPEDDLPSMLRELKRVSFQGEIALLVMRMASELCSRGILFLVRKRDLIGLGQFGMSSDTLSPAESMRGAIVPMDRPSILEQAVVTGQTQLRLFDATRLGYKSGQLSAFAIPMIISGAPRIVLYGDNFPGDRPLGALQELEILVAHASKIMTSESRKKNDKSSEAKS